MNPEALRLEPEWVIVVIASLVYTGEIVLAVPGKKFDAASLSQLAAEKLEDLLYFKHLEQPKGWNIHALKALFEILGMSTGMVQMIAEGKDEPVRTLQQEVTKLVKRIVRCQQSLREGMSFWGADILNITGADIQAEVLNKAKDFFESLQAFSTTGKLKNFRYSAENVLEHKKAIEIADELDALREFVMENGSTASWLITTETILPSGHQWLEKLKKVKYEVLDSIRETDLSGLVIKSNEIGIKLKQLKKNIPVYILTCIQNQGWV